MSQKLTLAYAALVGGNRHRQHGFRCSLW
jgi:hypothetical protein